MKTPIAAVIPASRQPKHQIRGQNFQAHGFTILDLLAVIGVLAFWVALLAPALAKTIPSSKAFQCLNNLRQVAAAWKLYTGDFNDVLLTCQGAIPGRTNWFTQTIEGPETIQNIKRSSIWPYCGNAPGIFKCPADRSILYSNGSWTPRVRSISMSQVFGQGEWLDRTYNPSQKVWRTYVKQTEIVAPAKTFVFLEEHPAGINDAAFANACTGNQPTDSYGAAWIVDYPAAFHNGGCTLNFADGHAEIHRWKGTKIRPLIGASLQLNVPAGDSWIDTHWLAENTTVKR